MNLDRHLRVLVVEDDRDTAESMKRLLELCGYQVESAYTGQEAVSTARKLLPRVVLCDIGLPDSDGYVSSPEPRHMFG